MGAQEPAFYPSGLDVEGPVGNISLSWVLLIGQRARSDLLARDGFDIFLSLVEKINK